MVCEQLNSPDCNPELSTLHHSSRLGLVLFTETLWIGESGRYILRVERKTAPPYIWYNLWMLLRLCPGLTAYKIIGSDPAWDKANNSAD